MVDPGQRLLEEPDYDSHRGPRAEQGWPKLQAAGTEDGQGTCKGKRKDSDGGGMMMATRLNNSRGALDQHKGLCTCLLCLLSSHAFGGLPSVASQGISSKSQILAFESQGVGRRQSRQP